MANDRIVEKGERNKEFGFFINCLKRLAKGDNCFGLEIDFYTDKSIF